MRPVALPGIYPWFVLVSALDVLLTWVILHLGGMEANAVAAWVIRNYDLPGLVVFKFGLVVLVVLICEVLARRNPVAARRLGWSAVGLTCVPLLVASGILLSIGRGPRDAHDGAAEAAMPAATTPAEVSR
jgi:hypothetical protein